MEWLLVTLGVTFGSFLLLKPYEDDPETPEGELTWKQKLGRHLKRL